MTGDPIHRARRIPYDVLIARLERARGLGCAYENGSDEFMRLARGLIVDEAAQRLVATPFPTFFNLGERLGSAPPLPFEACEKLHGSAPLRASSATP